MREGEKRRKGERGWNVNILHLVSNKGEIVFANTGPIHVAASLLSHACRLKSTTYIPIPFKALKRLPSRLIMPPTNVVRTEDLRHCRKNSVTWSLISVDARAPQSLDVPECLSLWK